MRLKEQFYVLTIEKYRNISKAAEILDITQPALTAFLNTLESTLGVKLFDRKTKPLTLTPAGELYVKTSAEILRLNEEFEKELSALLEQDIAQIRIGLQIIRAPHIVPIIKLIAKQNFPQINITFHENHGSILYEMLKNKELDLIICNKTITPPPDTKEVILAKNRLLLGVPASHPLASKKNLLDTPFPWIDISLFKNDCFNLLPPHYTISQYADQLFKNVGWTPKTIDSFTRTEAAMQMAAAGNGLFFILDGYLPLFHLPDNISFFTVGTPPVVSDYVAVYQKDYHKFSVFRKLLEILQFVLSKQ